MRSSVGHQTGNSGKGKGNISEEAPLHIKVHPIMTNIPSDKGELSHPGPQDTISTTINKSPITTW
jgi:hypothetical protein